MVRFLHTSDWHLGRLLYGKSLLDEQAAALERLLELIDRRKPHALLISGDVFDRAFPPEAAVKLFDSFCSRAVIDRGLQVFLIPGNHDSAERLGFGAKLLRMRGLSIYSRVEDALSPVKVAGDHGVEALVYGIPFVDPAHIARFLGQDELTTPDSTVRALASKMRSQHAETNPDLASVLLCHAFVVGGEASESERDLFVGGSSYVSADAFGGFTYTALGHLHKPQQAGAANIRYSGSLLAYSKSEIGHDKSVAEVSIDKNHIVGFEYHALPVARALRYVEGEIETLLRDAEKANAADRDAYVIAGLTDSGPVLDALSRLRVVYPNILHVSRAGGYVSSTLPALAKLKERESLSELELFAEFFTDTTGTEMSADERSCLIAAIEAVSNNESGVV